MAFLRNLAQGLLDKTDLDERLVQAVKQPVSATRKFLQQAELARINTQREKGQGLNLQRLQQNPATKYPTAYANRALQTYFDAKANLQQGNKLSGGLGAAYAGYSITPMGAAENVAESGLASLLQSARNKNLKSFPSNFQRNLANPYTGVGTTGLGVKGVGGTALDMLFDPSTAVSISGKVAKMTNAGDLIKGIRAYRKIPTVRMQDPDVDEIIKIKRYVDKTANLDLEKQQMVWNRVDDIWGNIKNQLDEPFQRGRLSGPQKLTHLTKWATENSEFRSPKKFVSRNVGMSLVGDDTAKAGKQKVKVDPELKHLMTYETDLRELGYPENVIRRTSARQAKTIMDKKLRYDPEVVIKTAKKEIGRPDKIKSLKQTAHDFYTDWVNRTHPIERLESGIEKKLNVKIRPEYSPSYAVKSLFGAGGRAEYRHHKSLEPILKRVEKIAKEDFDLYLKAKRDVELSKRGIKGSDKIKAQNTITALGSKYDVNLLDDVAEDLYAYQKQNLNMLEKSGILSSQAVSKIKAVNQKYVPFERVMDKVNDYLGLPTSVMQQSSQPIKRIKGSEKGILSPLEGIIANTYKTEAAISKNEVAKRIVGLQQIFPELPIKRVSKAKGAMTVWVDGQKHYYQVPDDILKVVKGLNEEQFDVLTQVLSAPARLLRQQATGRNLEFMIPNAWRDQFDAAINSEYGYKPIIGYLDGLRHLLNYKFKGTDDVVDSWIKSGGKIFFENMAGRKEVAKQISDAQNKRLTKKLMDWAIGGIETIGEYSETPTRIGLYKQAYKKTKNPLIAMRESREATIDFARRGAKMKISNALIPFLNVGVQGFDRMVRTAKNNPRRASIALLMYGAVPSTLTTIYNNIYHGEDWKRVPDFIKQDNFVLLTGTYDKDGDPEYFKLPKSHIQKYAANPVQELITYAYGNNPQGFSQFALNFIGESLPILEGGSTVQEAASKTVGSNLPQFAKPAVQSVANYDFFRAKPIVPSYLQNKPAAEQATKYTEGVYKKIGQVLNVSPLKVKNVLENTLAGGVKQPINLYKTIDAIVNGREVKPDDIFIARRFFGSYADFDVERPQKDQGETFLARITKPTSQVSAAEESLPENVDELEVLLKDAESTIRLYPEKKIKVKHGLIKKDLEEYQDEMDQAIKIRKQIEKERPEQVFKIRLESNSKNGSSTVEERAEWAAEQLEKGIDAAKLYDGQVLTKSVVELLNDQYGQKLTKYNYGDGYRNIGGTAKKPKAISVKVAPRKTTKISRGKIDYKLTSPKLAKMPQFKPHQPGQKLAKVKPITTQDVIKMIQKPLPKQRSFGKIHQIS